MLLSKWSWLCLCHSHSDTWRGLKRRHLSYQNSSWNCPQCPHTIWKLSQINPMLIQIHLQMDATMNNEWPDGCRGWENGVELGIFLQASVDCSSQLVLNSLPVVSANALQMMNGKEITIWNVNGPVIKYRIYWHFMILTLFCLSQKTTLIALGREKRKLKNYLGIEGCCFFRSGELLIISSQRTLFNRDAESWHFRSKNISFSLSSSKVAKCQRYICEKYWQLLGGHPLLANQASSILVGFTNNS